MRDTEVMATSATPSARRRILGGWLRHAREEAGKTIKDAAEILAVTEQSVSRLETGNRGLRILDVRVLMDAYGITERDVRHRFERLAAGGRQKDWFDSFGDLLDERSYRDWLGLEKDAAELRSYEPLVMPGLLQTEDYARAVIAASRPGANSEQVDRLAEVRMRRQQVLTGAHPVALWVVIDESVLRRRVGGREVQRAQLERLSEIMDGALPTVTIQVMSFDAGAHTGTDGGFTLLGFAPGSTDVVWLEALSTSVVLGNGSDTALYSRVFSHLMARATPPDETKTLVREVLKEL